MGEVIEQLKETTTPMGATDTRERYPGTCPKCGQKMFICKSIAMVMGINTGTGTCRACGLFMHIEFNSESKSMELEPFDRYVDRIHARQSVEGKKNEEG